MSTSQSQGKPYDSPPPLIQNSGAGNKQGNSSRTSQVVAPTSSSAALAPNKQKPIGPAPSLVYVTQRYDERYGDVRIMKNSNTN